MATQQQKISALYAAFFNRAPDKEGLNFWEAEMNSNGGDLSVISNGFSQHPTFASLYNGLTNQKFVEAIYTNMLGGSGDAAGITHWVGRLENGQPKSDMVAEFVETA